VVDEDEPEGGDEETFHVSVPVPPFPPQGRNVMYWRAEAAGSSGRDFEDVMMRRIPASVAHRFRGAAGARGLTHAQYLGALVALHEAIRQRADEGEPEAAALLDHLGLRTVTI
jgi:hypothetical protein